MNQIKHHFNKFHCRSTGLLLVRLAAGIIFVYHGYMKLSDMTSTIAFFASLGLGAFFAYLVALVEFAGGISLIIGYGARYFATALAITMVFSIILVKSKIGFTASEIDIMLLATMLAIVFSGCGKYSVCAMMHHKKCMPCKDGGNCECQHK